MQSVLPLNQRLAGRVKRPREIERWSQSAAGTRFDDSALRYYYFPQPAVDRDPPINLARGFDAAKYDPDANLAVYLDTVLAAVQHHEQQNGTRVEADIVTWRGILTKLIVLSQAHAEPNVLKEPLDLLVAGFDGQVFMAEPPRSDPAAGGAAWSSTAAGKRFMYSGFQFEHVATLAKPWGETSREEIDARYGTGHAADHAEYGILVKSGIGAVDMVYGAETDCVEGFKDPDDKLAHYVELKTSSYIEHEGQARNFERKLLRNWVQSFLAGVPKIVYGFRDNDMLLRAVEEYKTDDLPKVQKNSELTRPQQRWNGNDAIKFYAILVQWIKDKVADGKTYRLTYAPRAHELVLKEAEIIVEGRKVAFLSNEFVEWRTT